jgi:type II secretory pathway pseudopilin PulG
VGGVIVVLVVFVVIILVVAAIVVNYFVQEGKQRQFSAAGVAAQAVILAIAPTGGGNRSYSRGLTFTLEVRPANQPPYQAKTDAVVAIEDLPQFQVGALVPILYNPGNPAQVKLN